MVFLFASNEAVILLNSIFLIEECEAMARPYCQRCKKPEQVCLCSYLDPQENAKAVIILRHPDERSKALGTASLIELGLSKALIVDALHFHHQEIRDLLLSFSCTEPLLIYPQPLNEEYPHYVFDFEKDRFTSLALQKTYDSIILLDGTWRNTRELLHCNSWLKRLPSLNLVNIGQSRYRIRQAKQEGAVATIEAAAFALTLLDETFQADRLIKPFEKMIEFQIEKMGQSVYQVNYLQKEQD